MQKDIQQKEKSTGEKLRWNLTQYLSSPLGMMSQELYKTSELMIESSKTGGRNKFKLESSTIKNTTLFENSKNESKNLAWLPLNKRV